MASQMEDRRGCFGRLGATTWANRCALPMCHREEEERSTRKKEEEAAEQQQQHRRWRDGVVGVVDSGGRQLTGEWSRASRSSLVPSRPAFPRLASPSMSFFRGCCSTCPSPPPPPRHRYHMPARDVYVAIQCVGLRDRELHCARADLLV